MTIFCKKTTSKYDTMMLDEVVEVRLVDKEAPSVIPHPSIFLTQNP